MSKILINYNYNKAKDQYILLDSGVVFADLPVAVMDSEVIIKEPLIVPINGTNTVVEKAAYTSVNKKFRLALDKDGKVVESPEGSEIWLPKDTDVSRLEYVNGQLLLREEQEKTVDEGPIVEQGPIVEENNKPKPKSTNKGNKK